MLNVGILLFNEVEVLDFAGPFEVFSKAEQNHKKVCMVKTIGETGEIIVARNGLKVKPDYSYNDRLELDLLLLPGGYGAEEIEIKNPNTLKWIADQHAHVEVIASVCTGAFLLAEIGILTNKKATTHWADLDRLENDYPHVEVIRNVKFVDEGRVLTSAGISAGINLSFHLLQRYFGKNVARETAKRMEYDITI